MRDEMRDDMRTNAGDDAGQEGRRDTRFDTETARKAAERRWSKARGTITLTSDPVVRDPALVEDALWRKAQEGDVAAARELRAWRGEGDGEEGLDPWKTITRQQRERLLELLDDEDAQAATHPPAA